MLHRGTSAGSVLGRCGAVVLVAFAVGVVVVGTVQIAVTVVAYYTPPPLNARFGGRDLSPWLQQRQLHLVVILIIILLVLDQLVR